MQHRPHREGD